MSGGGVSHTSDEIYMREEKLFFQLQSHLSLLLLPPAE